MHRKVGDRDLFLDAYTSTRGCVCTGETCVPVRPPTKTSIMDWSADHVLGARFDDAGEQQVRLAAPDGTNETLSPPLGRCVGMAFADGASAAFAVCRRGEDSPHELYELGLPRLELRRQHRLEDLESRGVSLLAGRSAVIVANRNAWSDARILRRSDGHETATLHVRDDFAIVRYDDGAVELFGNVPNAAIACVDGDKISPLAACRARLEVKQRFRFD